MKSIPFSAMFLLVLFVSAVVVAQEKTPPSPPPTQPPPATPDNPAPTTPANDPAQISPEVHKRFAGQTVREGFSNDDIVNRRIAAFVRLRDMMFETLKFGAEKKARINTIFDDYLAGILYGNYRPHVQPLPQNMATPQQLPELKKQLEAAEKDGDKEKIESLKAKIYAANIALEPHIVDEPAFFFDYLAAELSEEEKAKFLPVMERWRLLRVAEIAPDNDFKHLLRSARDPMLGLSEEKLKELRVMLIEAMRTVPFPQRNDQKVMTELAMKTKPKVLEQLDAKQRAQFEETLKMLDQWQREDVELAAKTRERLKNYTASTGESNSAAGSAPKPEAAPSAKP